MLLSVLHQCLYNLKNTDAVTTMEWTDYDEEAEQHSDKAYGSLSNKRRTVSSSGHSVEDKKCLTAILHDWYILPDRWQQK